MLPPGDGLVLVMLLLVLAALMTVKVSPDSGVLTVCFRRSNISLMSVIYRQTLGNW
jgi:hypothetical protein